MKFGPHTATKPRRPPALQYGGGANSDPCPCEVWSCLVMYYRRCDLNGDPVLDSWNVLFWEFVVHSNRPCFPNPRHRSGRLHYIASATLRSVGRCGSVLVELRLCEWWSFGGSNNGSQHAIWAFFLDSRKGCWRGLGLAILSRERQDTMCVSVLVAEIRPPGT